MKWFVGMAMDFGTEFATLPVYVNRVNQRDELCLLQPGRLSSIMMLCGNLVLGVQHQWQAMRTSNNDE